jgi:hypothetical protein
VLFSIPLLGVQANLGRSPIWLRALAVAGLGTTLLYVVLSVLPIVPVASQVVFALKITALVVGANVVGVGLYLSGRRRR